MFIAIFSSTCFLLPFMSSCCRCCCCCFLLRRPRRSHLFFRLFMCPEFRSPSHAGNLNRSASLSCSERVPENASVGGSVTQIPGTPFQYVPDFCVRALADLQFVKVGGRRLPESRRGPVRPNGRGNQTKMAAVVQRIKPTPTNEFLKSQKL